MKTLSFRIDEEEDEELEHIAKKLKSDKSSVARRAMELGIKNLKTIEALEKIRVKKWTIWRAAKYCGESYRSFLELLRRENIPFPTSIDEIKSELNEESYK